MKLMIEHDLQQTMLLLDRTPAALNGLLRELPAAWILRNEGENSWSVFDVVSHLTHCERADWMSRAKMILQFGETQMFETVDRGGHIKDVRNQPLEQLLDEFARLRSCNLRELRGLSLQQQDLARRGRHPALGLVTLSELLATWATHDLTHLHQITRIMAYQYRDEVGPWSRYLGVLQCAGHSSPA